MLTLLDLTVGSTTYKYSDQPSAAFPDYAPRLDLHSEIEIQAADIQAGNPKTTVCRVWLSNRIIPRYSDTHPTLLEILNADNEIINATARVRKYDTRTQTTQHDFTGRVTRVGDFAEQYARIVVQVHVQPSRTVMVPPRRLLDIFQHPDLEETAVLAWVFGHAKSLRLPLVANDDVIQVEAATTEAGDFAVIWTMTGPPRVAAELGDTLQYDVAIGEIRGMNAIASGGYTFRLYLDIGTATEWLSDVAGIGDTLGQAPGHDFTSESPGRFFRRIFNLPDSWAGQQITRTRIVAIPGQQTIASFGVPQGILGFLARARIFDVTGASKQEIIQTDRTYTGSDSGRATEHIDITPITADQFGAWRNVLTDETAAYINGVHVPKDIGGSGAGFLIGEDSGLFGDSSVGILSFNDMSASFDPFQFPVHLDAISYEFERNPALALAFVLREIGYAVDETALLTAKNAFTALAMTVGGAVTTPTQAGIVLADLLFHGTSLEHGQNGVQILVDTKATHPLAAIELGAGDGGGWNNFEVVSVEARRTIDEFQIRAGYDPGVMGRAERWTASVNRMLRSPVEVEYQRDLPYLGDTDTVGREARYRCSRLEQPALIVRGRIPTTAYGAETLRFGQRVFLSVPLRGLNRREMEIVGWHQTQDSIELSLVPWDANIFDGDPLPVEGSIFLNEAIPQGGLPPDPPTGISFTQNRFARTITRFDSFFPSYLVTFYLQATAPADNVSHLIFSVQQVGGATVLERSVSVTPGETVQVRVLYDASGGYQGWNNQAVYGRVQSFQQANAITRQRSAIISTPATVT